MCVDVEPGMRTAAAVTWEAAAKISVLVLALSLLDRGCCSSVYCSTTRCCSSMGAGVAAAGGGGLQKAIRPSRWWSRIVLVVGTGYYVSHGSKAAVPRNPDGKKQRKTSNLRKKITSAYAHAPFSTGQHMGRPMGQHRAGPPASAHNKPWKKGHFSNEDPCATISNYSCYNLISIKHLQYQKPKPDSRYEIRATSNIKCQSYSIRDQTQKHLEAMEDLSEKYC